MNYFLSSCLVIFFAFSHPAHASFSDASKEIILNGKYRFSNSWVGTVWSSCWARKFSKAKLNADHVIAAVPSQSFNSGEYLANVLINRGDRGERLEKAPVTFVINGIFGEPVSGLVRQLAIPLLEKGHHVVGLGNPLGTWAIKQKPNYTVGNFVRESEVYLEIMNEVHAWLSARGLAGEQVNLLGVSYGGFISAIIKSMDSAKGNSLISGMTTLLSPPLIMGPALRNMDHALFQTQSLGKMPDWVLASVSLRFCLLPPRRYVDPIQLRWAKALFGYYGFQRSLADATMLLDELYDLGKVPTGKRERTMWRRTFTFSDYIRDYSSDLGELMDSPEGVMDNWLRTISESEYRIFASLDDPLNEEVPWTERDNQFLIEYGGHYGLRGFPFFDDFLFSIF